MEALLAIKWGSTELYVNSVQCDEETPTVTGGKNSQLFSAQKKLTVRWLSSEEHVQTLEAPLTMKY